MDILTVDVLRDAHDELLIVLEDDPALRRTAEERISSAKDSCDFTLVDHCLSRYISAELDYLTPGARGIGRTSTNVPRFGAYFRKRLRGLPPSDREQLYKLIHALMIRGYGAAIAFPGKVKADQPVTEPELLYEEWILVIYFTTPPPEVSGMLEQTSSGAFNRVKEFLRSRRMVGGGLFSSDKTDMILSFYPLAGFLLRCLERPAKA